MNQCRERTKQCTREGITKNARITPGCYQGISSTSQRWPDTFQTARRSYGSGQHSRQNMLTYLNTYLQLIQCILIMSVTLRTFLLTPWCRVLLEKPIGSELVKKFPAFYGTQRFITAFTSARQLSLSSASSIQSIPPPPTYPPIYAWVFQVVTFPQVSPPKPCFRLSSPPYVLHAPLISFFSILSP
jgi:hypothetical protein